MEIKAVKFRTNGFYTQPFVFGGEEGVEKFDKNVRYRGSLQKTEGSVCRKRREEGADVYGREKCYS